MPFAAANLLGTVVAAWATLFARPDRLAIHDSSAGFSFSTGGLPDQCPHGIVDRLPGAVAAPRPEVVINRSPRRQVMRQQVPGTTTADYVEVSIQDFTPCVLGGTAAWFGGGHQRFQMVPFGIGEVSIIGISGFHTASLHHTFSNALLDLGRNGQSASRKTDVG